MEMHEFIDLKVNKIKLEKIKKFYTEKSDQEIIDQILDDILYNAEMLEHMKTYEGKGDFKKVYE